MKELGDIREELQKINERQYLTYSQYGRIAALEKKMEALIDLLSEFFGEQCK